MEKRPLTDEEKIKIYITIFAHMRNDDRFPREVIITDFGGDEEKYLRVMAEWHHVPINEEQEVPV